MADGTISREYGPFEGVDGVYGVDTDGERIWYAAGDSIRALDPETGELTERIDVQGDAGTAYDGTHLYQLYEDEIRRIDPKTGTIVSTVACPCGTRGSGMAWAEGSLWIGEYRGRKIHRVDAETGELLATLESNRLVTGVTWADGELWHGAVEEEDVELRRIDAKSGEVRERIHVGEPGVMVTGIAPTKDGRFFCGGGSSGKVRVVGRGED